MTYTETLEYIKTLAENTRFVNTVTEGEIASLDLDKANIFPMVHIDISDGNFVNGAVAIFNVSLTALQQRDILKEVVADKFWRQDNKVDNHNETMLILQTIWLQLFKDWQDLYISSEESPAFGKITYAKGNILDGWTLNFVIEIPIDITLCDD